MTYTIDILTCKRMEDNKIQEYKELSFRQLFENSTNKIGN